MLRLFILRVSLAAWKRSLSISSKLKARTWIAMAIVHASFAVVSFWGYQATSVSENAIPAVITSYLSERPDFKRAMRGSSWELSALSSLEDRRFRALPQVPAGWDPITIGEYTGSGFDRGHMTPGGNRGSINEQTAHFSMHTNGSTTAYPIQALLWGGNASLQFPREGLITYYLHLDHMAPSPRISYLHAGQTLSFNRRIHQHFAIVLQRDPFNFPVRLPDMGRTTVVQIPSSEESSLLTPFERTLAILSGIINALLSTVNLLVLWQVWRRSKAEAILLRLQTELLRSQIAQLRDELEAVRREAQKSGIIVLS